MEGRSHGRRARAPPCGSGGSSPKRRCTGDTPKNVKFKTGPSLFITTAEGSSSLASDAAASPPAAGASPRELHEGPTPSFWEVLHYRLSSGTYLLHLLQHVLRQRLRAALRGELHQVTVEPSAKALPSKRPAFEPSPEVEALLRGNGSAAALLASSSSSGSGSSKGGSVETVAGALAAKLTCCLQLKEKSSVLVLGPRGSGATAAVEAALRFVQQQQQQQQQLLVVRVNCSLYPNDAAILQAIVRRLCAALQQQQQQQQGGSFEEWLLRLKDLLTDSCSLLNRAVIIVLDRVEVCCMSGAPGGPPGGPGCRGGGPAQHLLYNLFDLQHGHGLHICSVCLSPVLDLTDFMEKRIRSRFTMQKLRLSAAVDTPQLLEFMRQKLLRVTAEELMQARVKEGPLKRALRGKQGAPEGQGGPQENAAEEEEEDRRRAREFVRAFDAAVNARLNDKRFQALSERALSLGRPARNFLLSAVSPLLLLHPPLPRAAAAAAAAAAWGAPETPEALSPLHSPLRQKESPQKLERPAAAAAAAAQLVQQQQQQQQQEQGPLLLCEDALYPGGREAEDAAFLSSLSFCEHLVLAAMARLHKKQQLPKTFLLVLQEVSCFFKMHDTRRRGVSQPGLRRAFARLQEAGLLQRCAFGLQHLGLPGAGVDLHGSHLPFKFPGHESYAAAIPSLPVPSELALWLTSQSFNV